jgi:lysophospholipase L1-like esterase
MKKDMTVLKAMIDADYKRHIKKFDQLKPDKKCVLLGDSMMAYFPTKAFDLDKDMHNLGIPGDTTTGVLNRIEQVANLNPKIIILNIGLNDFVLTKLTHQESLDNILDIRHQLLEKCLDTTVFVTSLTPINQKDFQDQVYLLNRDPKDAIKLNEMLSKVIDQKHFINIYDELIDDEGNLKLELTRDGIHLNQKGYQIYYHRFNKLINDIDENAHE